jgi:TonB family protein
VDVRGDVVESNAVRDVVERRLRSARLYDSDAESALLVDVYAFPTTARVTATFRRRDGQPLPLGWPAEFRGNPLTDESVLRVVGRTVDEFLLDYLGATEETCEPADPGDEVGSVDPVFPVREPERVASESSSLDFTRGSHRDDVLRIQGTPSSVNQYSDHETWRYGMSTIDISLRDQRVTEWNNLGGNLKVRLDPGPNVTDAQAFTRGSHREGVFQTGEITDLPMILFKVDPQYSEEARKAQYQGTVVLEAIIRSDGTIEILRVVRSLDFGLDENAIQALKQWKFRPGMRNGQPVDVALNIEVNFNLR